MNKLSKQLERNTKLKLEKSFKKVLTKSWDDDKINKSLKTTKSDKMNIEN